MAPFQHSRADFCVEALEEALGKDTPEVFNTDGGDQFTNDGFNGLLGHQGIGISMDGEGRYADNIFVEQLWRLVKYEEVNLKAYSGRHEAEARLDAYFRFYNPHRHHQALGYRTPAEVFIGDSILSLERFSGRRMSALGAFVNPRKKAGLSLNKPPTLSN